MWIYKNCICQIFAEINVYCISTYPFCTLFWRSSFNYFIYYSTNLSSHSSADFFFFFSIELLLSVRFFWYPLCLSGERAVDSPSWAWWTISASAGWHRQGEAHCHVDRCQPLSRVRDVSFWGLFWFNPIYWSVPHTHTRCTLVCLVH